MSKLVKRFNLADLWEYGKNESWFSDMAARGLHLKSFGKYLVTFEKGQPKKTKYRIEILEESPSQEQLDLYKDYGWELVTNKKIFYIFSSPEELNAPELQTDPMEQSFTFKMIKKELKKNSIVISLGVLIMLALVCFQFFFDSEPYLNLIRRSTITTIMLTIGYIYMLFESIRGYCVVKKIKDSLENGIPFNHKQKWKLTYITSSIVYILLIVMVLTAIFIPIYEVIRTEQYTYKAVKDISPIYLEEIETSPLYDYWHSLRSDWSFLSPIQHSIYEGAYVDAKNSEDISLAYSPTSLNIRYYELTFKGIAEGLINDLIHRYYREHQYEIPLAKKESRKFDQLYIAHGETKLIFAGLDKKVIYIKYTGNSSVEEIITLIEEKYDL